MSYFFQNSLTRENEHFEHIDSAAILSLQKGSAAWDWISIFACSPKVNSDPLIYIFHPSIDSIPVNSFKQEGSPTPKANFFHYIQLTLIMSSVGSGSLLCQVTDPKPVSYLEHCIDMVHTTSDKPISRTFQGFFKDKLQFAGTKNYSTNQHSLTLFWTPYWLKHVMESFTILTSSAMVDHIILNYFPQQHFQNDWVWLTIASEVQK